MKRAQVTFDKPSRDDLKQRFLVKYCIWDEYDQKLYLDARELYPELGVMQWLAWDAMLLDGEPIPDYPINFKPFDWPKRGDLLCWSQQVPDWVKQSCQMFPSHQLKLLHYCAKYPQILELLDHSPVLAWQLMKFDWHESELVALLSGKRVDLVAQVGWPGKSETVKFLRNLRLRFVNQQIAEYLETCMLDDVRLEGLQSLPRINSMALTLAAAFPHLIGSRLHQSLAQMPCRPMQCQSMIALLEDVYLMAELSQQPAEQLALIGQCRYLVEVKELYLAWLAQSLPAADKPLPLSATPSVVQDLVALSHLVQHPWALLAHDESVVVAWCVNSEGQTLDWSAQVTVDPQSPEHFRIDKVRGTENRLPDQQAYGSLHLWLMRHWHQLR